MIGIDAAVPGLVWQLLFGLGLLAVPAAAVSALLSAGIAPRVLAIFCGIGLAVAVGGVAFAPQVEMIAGWFR